MISQISTDTEKSNATINALEEVCESWERADILGNRRRQDDKKFGRCCLIYYFISAVFPWRRDRERARKNEHFDDDLYIYIVADAWRLISGYPGQDATEINGARTRFFLVISHSRTLAIIRLWIQSRGIPRRKTARITFARDIEYICTRYIYRLQE